MASSASWSGAWRGHIERAGGRLANKRWPDLRHLVAAGEGRAAVRRVRPPGSAPMSDDVDSLAKRHSRADAGSSGRRANELSSFLHLAVPVVVRHAGSGPMNFLRHSSNRGSSSHDTLYSAACTRHHAARFGAAGTARPPHPHLPLPPPQPPQPLPAPPPLPPPYP